jgi:transposase
MSFTNRAWRRMILNYLNDREDFLEKYNAIRPKAETTISSVKRTIAYWLRSEKKGFYIKKHFSFD